MIRPLIEYNPPMIVSKTKAKPVDGFVSFPIPRTTEKAIRNISKSMITPVNIVFVKRKSPIIGSVNKTSVIGSPGSNTTGLTGG
jgi:hypothetical protein